MEARSCLLKRAKDGGFLLGWRVSGRGGDGVDISHLLFGDDTLVLCKLNQDQLTYLSWLLMWFEAISWLSIDLEKSELILMGRVEIVEELALEFGCKVEALLSSYLGLPFQVHGSMGWGGGKVSQKAYHVEKAVLIQGWEDYPNLKHSF